MRAGTGDPSTVRRARASSGADTPARCKTVAPVSPRRTDVRSWTLEGGPIPFHVEEHRVGVGAREVRAVLRRVGESVPGVRVGETASRVRSERAGTRQPRSVIESLALDAGTRQSRVESSKVDDEQLRSQAGHFQRPTTKSLGATARWSARHDNGQMAKTVDKYKTRSDFIGAVYGAIYSTGELRMLVINAPGAAVVTTTEVKRDVPGTFKVAESHRVYVTKDGQPIGGIVSVAMMEFLEEALSDRQMARIAARRHSAVVKGEDELLEADDFFAQADAAMLPGPRR